MISSKLIGRSRRRPLVTSLTNTPTSNKWNVSRATAFGCIMCSTTCFLSLPPVMCPTGTRWIEDTEFVPVGFVEASAPYGTEFRCNKLSLNPSIGPSTFTVTSIFMDFDWDNRLSQHVPTTSLGILPSCTRNVSQNWGNHKVHFGAFPAYPDQDMHRTAARALLWTS